MQIHLSNSPPSSSTFQKVFSLYKMYTQKNITASADNVQCTLYNVNCWHIWQHKWHTKVWAMQKVIGMHAFFFTKSNRQTEQ